MSRFSGDYKTAALRLTIAVANMTKAIDTPGFDRAFWSVQTASARLKRMRAAIEDSARGQRNIYSLVS